MCNINFTVTTRSSCIQKLKTALTFRLISDYLLNLDEMALLEHSFIAQRQMFHVTYSQRILLIGSHIQRRKEEFQFLNTYVRKKTISSPILQLSVWLNNILFTRLMVFIISYENSTPFSV